MAVLAGLRELADVLDRLGLKYAVGGSVASSVHGEPRSTYDVDALLELPIGRAPALVRELEGRFYVDEVLVREAVSRGQSFNILHWQTHLRLDLFVAGAGALDRAQLHLAKPRRIPGLERDVPVTAPEVLVLRKLEWSEKENPVSERQWRDVLGILKAQGPRLDRELMDDLAQRSGLADLLAKAMGESGTG